MNTALTGHVWISWVVSKQVHLYNCIITPGLFIFIQLLTGRYNHRDCRQFDKIFALCLVMHCMPDVLIVGAESLYCLQVKRFYSHIDLKSFHENICRSVLPLLHNKLLRLLGYHTFRGTQFGRPSLPFRQLTGLMFPIPASLTHHLGQPQARVLDLAAKLTRWVLEYFRTILL